MCKFRGVLLDACQDVLSFCRQGYQRVTRNPNPPTTSERGSVGFSKQIYLVIKIVLLITDRLKFSLRRSKMGTHQNPPLATSPQLFHSKLKTLLSTNLILICPLPRTSLHVSAPSTIHHSRLTVCLPACLTLWI